MNKSLSLIICTYMRPQPLATLLASVQMQTVYPDEILIIDGSVDDETGLRFRESGMKNLHYFKVPPEHRGLTKQRNYGIDRVNSAMEIVTFLDDDVILDSKYFYEIIKTYATYPEALGVGGYITNEVKWEKVSDENQSLEYFYFDGYRRKESSRYKLRRKLGLDQKLPPAWYPEFGHGRSVGFLPSSGKTYQVEMLMGGVSSFPIKVLKKHKFSEYFDGYGLYEDADFTLRLSKIGKLYVNTAAQLEHHHAAAGRPNKYSYGKMVVRNGWYVWRVKHTKPSFVNKVKWYQITLLLTGIRFLNIFTTPKRKESFTEFLGRTVGMISLILIRPK